MPRCWLGGSEVMVASRPPSATASSAGGAGRCCVGRRGHPVAFCQRADLAGPVVVVVVDDLARPQRGHPLLAGRACRSDDLGAAQHGEGDQQAAGESGGAMDQELLTGVDVQCLAQNLPGRQSQYREGGRSAPAGTVWLAGSQPGRGDQPGRPRPLFPQR